MFSKRSTTTAIWLILTAVTIMTVAGFSTSPSGAVRGKEKSLNVIMPSVVVKSRRTSNFGSGSNRSTRLVSLLAQSNNNDEDVNDKNKQQQQQRRKFLQQSLLLPFLSFAASKSVNAFNGEVGDINESDVKMERLPVSPHIHINHIRKLRMIQNTIGDKR